MILLSLLQFSCSDDEARPEVIDKLRAFGVSYDPFVSSGAAEGETLSITSKVLLVSDSDQDISARLTKDERILGVLSLPSTLDEKSQTLEHDGVLKVFSFTSNVVLPTNSNLVFLPESPFVTFSLGYEMEQGEEIEKIVSRYVIHPEGSEEAGWASTPPEVKIMSLSNGDKIAKKDIELKAEISNRNGESYKVSWYVSSGEVTNRRAIDTKWKEMKTGEQTVIVAIHGSKTASFSWQALNITVE